MRFSGVGARLRVLIVFLLIVGSLWIMTHLNHNMLSMEHRIQMQR